MTSSRPGTAGALHREANAVLAAIAAAGITARKETGSMQLSVWEWEGGHLRDHEATPDRSRPVPAGHAGPARCRTGIVMTRASAAIGVPGAAPSADRTVIRLGGALDIAAAPALRERLTGVLRSGISLLIVDLSRILSCDVCGLAVLVGAQHRARRLGVVMRLAAPSLPVVQLLRSTGLERCFAIYPGLSAH